MQPVEDILLDEGELDRLDLFGSGAEKKSERVASRRRDARGIETDEFLQGLELGIGLREQRLLVLLLSECDQGTRLVPGLEGLCGDLSFSGEDDFDLCAQAVGSARHPPVFKGRPSLDSARGGNRGHADRSRDFRQSPELAGS